LDKKEWNTLLEIGREMTAKKTLACTACRYCTDRCPQELNIPEIIKKYNEHLYSGHPYEAGQDNLNPAACLGCGACEAVCPQQIRITEMMAELTEALA
jgi:predicted aldo/keto reductase-like oxidoreductase